MIANQWRKNVAFLQKHTASNADSFLTFADINSAGDVPAAIKADELLFERARQQHPAKRFEKSFMHRSSRRRFLRRRFFPALRRLKHRPILRKIANRAQKIFAPKIDATERDWPFFRRGRSQRERIGVPKVAIRAVAASVRSPAARSISSRPIC